MKKLLILLASLSLIFCLLFTSCAGNDPSDNSEKNGDETPPGENTPNQDTTNQA